MQLQESGQMYLETIKILLAKKGYVRSVDIAEYMNYSKPSISRAMSILRRNDYILMDKDGHISFTEKGQALADKIYERHTVLTEFLVQLGVDEENSANDACRIEHVISDPSFNVIKQYVNDHKKN